MSPRTAQPHRDPCDVILVFLEVILSEAKDLCNSPGLHKSLAAKDAAQDGTMFREEQ